MSKDNTSLIPRVSHADLIRFIAAAYRAVGIPQTDAAKAAELMAASEKDETVWFYI